MDKKCPICGNEVIGSKHRIYCNNKCKNKMYYKNNREKRNNSTRLWRENNKEYIKKYMKEYENSKHGKFVKKNYLEKNKERINEWHKNYRKENIYQIKIRIKRYKTENKDKIKKQDKLYRGSEKGKSTRKKYNEKYSEDIKLWRKENKESINHRNKLRQMKIKNQIPFFTDINKIKEFYINCPNGFHVDHIIPISKGGPHCIENLQYLTAKENLKKNNKMPKTISIDLAYVSHRIMFWQDGIKLPNREVN